MTLHLLPPLRQIVSIVVVDMVEVEVAHGPSLIKVPVLFVH